MSYKASVLRKNDTIHLVGEAAPAFVDAVRTFEETYPGDARLGEFTVHILENLDEKASEYYAEIPVSDLGTALETVKQAEYIARKNRAEILRKKGRIKAIFLSEYREHGARATRCAELFANLYSTLSLNERLGQED